MSDEHDDHDPDAPPPSEGLPPFFIGTPENLEAMQRQMQEAQDRAMMAATAARHQITRFFDELSIEQMTTLRTILSHVQNQPQIAFFYDGIAAQTLNLKHNVCAGCGVDHDQEELDALGKLSNGETSKDRHPSVPAPSDDEREKYVAAMDHYGVEPLTDDVDLYGPVRCKNCKKEYVNLADRMVDKPGPEGCEGCVLKTKFG